MDDTEQIGSTEQEEYSEIGWRTRSIEFIKRKRGYLLIAAGLFLFLCAIGLLYRAPSEFPVGQSIRVQQGQSLREISQNLYSRHAIVSPLLFKVAVTVFGGGKSIKAGEYLLDVRDGIITLAWRLVKGEFHIGMTKLTIPEGWNTTQIANYLGAQLPKFDTAKFLTLARPQEGFLFPDTYFVAPNATPEEVLDLMKQNYQTKVAGLSELTSSQHSVHDIIVMASILEEEGKTPESMKMISGILWKRIQLGMPLQVDSAFTYVNGKNTYTLTADDLKTDSAYNTYTRTGLPPTPISNPGLDAIEAALNPTQSDYLYFLSSKDGTMHYAKTFDEHVHNKQKYL